MIASKISDDDILGRDLGCRHRAAVALRLALLDCPYSEILFLIYETSAASVSGTVGFGMESSFSWQRRKPATRTAIMSPCCAPTAGGRRRTRRRTCCRIFSRRRPMLWYRPAPACSWERARAGALLVRRRN
jgi:hypothetical protein